LASKTYSILTDSIIVIIPARKNSVRLPNKHTLKIGDKSLIDMTSQQIVNSGLKLRCIMSTDCEDIAEAGRQKGWEVPHLRPDHLSTSTSSSVSVIEHELKHIKQADKKLPNLILLLQLTSPLRTGQHIRQAVETIRKDPTVNAVVSMRKIKIPPIHTYIKSQNSRFAKQSSIENGDHFLVPNGAIYLIRTTVFESMKTLFPKNISPLIMNDTESLDIDTWADWAQLKFFIENHENKF